MPLAISPHYYIEDFPGGLSLDQKIEVFGDRVLGWQLVPAQELADKVPHSGFAVLHIVMNYFESIAKFRYGNRSTKESGKYFRLGFEWVFPEICAQIPNKAERRAILDSMYSKIRCGIYHAGIPGMGIVLTGGLPGAMEIRQEAIVINPHKIVDPLKNHLSNYLREIRNPANENLRKNFECRFDWLGSEQKDETACSEPPED